MSLKSRPPTSQPSLLDPLPPTAPRTQPHTMPHTVRRWVYTDGACKHNPGPGGWAAVITCEGSSHVQELSGFEDDTTNNRMELLAAIKGLAAVEPPCPVTIVTDSEYVYRGMNEWMAGWIRKGWKTASKKPVLNQDLWRQLNEVCADRPITWEWTRGHSGHPGNERADALASAQAHARKATLRAR